MYYLFITSIFILSISCQTDKKNFSEVVAIAENPIPATPNLNAFLLDSTANPQPYTLTLSMETLDMDSYQLVIAIALHNDSYFVSPNAKRDFSGKFTLLLDNETHLQRTALLEEIPLSVEEYDPHPFVRGTVNWVRQNTVYKQRMVRNTETDFQVSGRLRFTIEPRCSLEQIPIVITYKNGKIKAELSGC
ncbi:MAG: hypothetical protein R2781_02570 [Flavobacteriaceae bacterium]